MVAPAQPPQHQSRLWGPTAASSVETLVVHQSPSKLPVDFSPPLIAMVVIAAAAFLVVTYSRLISRHLFPPLLRLVRRYRRWRRRRPHLPSVSDIDSPSYEPSDGFYVYSPYGLDESVIKTMPLSIYTRNTKSKGLLEVYPHDCAVCLLEFEENDYIRTLPQCSHSFHVDCIDIWLRSHANCPLCRAGICRPESPFVPMMAARIRPSLDEGLLESVFLEPLPEAPPTRTPDAAAAEIVPAIEISSSPRRNQSEDRANVRDCLLERSYSFGFERNFPSERLVLEPATASPWRYHRRGSFWRRPSPFSSLPKSRVFSFRHYRGMKSPFYRRRGLVPLSESASVRYAYSAVTGSVAGGSSRRSKSMTSPMFGRSSAAMFSSSRLRCGDPEALLSPERYSRR
ncbi:hypothetical protein Nepgr_004573 [Nepenthes gracilis]|uniref:RING-type E3 ubiquitin transferase n=1 Tax=Nepenthes gracilis TaxID=150966 RepID=A0AAD3S1M7_NEPGR|nr:hypothetical protein Nepgr_004573 [Nepenthes gracilis]